VSDFGDPGTEHRAARVGDVVADLSHSGLIAVSGTDAMTFLQGQLINDFRIIKRAETYYLMLTRELLAPLMRRLRLYVLRAKVQLDDASDEWVTLGFQGEAAASAARAVLGELPARVDEARQAAGLTVVRLHGTPHRFLSFGLLEASRRLWEGLSGPAIPVGAGAWTLTDISAGVPTIHAETSDLFVPQMVNYQALGGISFTKGCYTGQEVVARTQYLGKLKRRMYRAHVDSDAAPVPGDELYAPGFPGGQSVGRLVSAESSPGGGYEVLAVIQIESAERDTVHLGDIGGPVLALQALPYSPDA
jgi:folate-binding protein YgfZ